MPVSIPVTDRTARRPRARYDSREIPLVPVAAMTSARRAFALAVPVLALALPLPAAAQYDSLGYTYGHSNGLFTEQLRRERELAEWRLVASLLSDYRTAFKRPSYTPAPVGPTSWRAQNENPWANAYGTPSSPASKYSTVSRVTASTTYHVCTCYIPADARSWDGGPLTQADVARRCQAQCP